MSKLKIPVTRLKVLQVSKNDLPFGIGAYCLDNPAFVDNVENIGNAFCHSDIFENMLEEGANPDMPQEMIDTLEALAKRFRKCDYIMII